MKTAVSAICTALITLGVMRLIAPDGNKRRLVEIAFGIATVLAIAIPLSKGIKLKTDFNFAASEENTELADTATEQIVRLSSAQVESAVGDVLSAAGITATEISAHMDISDTGGIFIKCVKIKGVESGLKSTAVQVVAAAFNIDEQDVEVWDE